MAKKSVGKVKSHGTKSRAQVIIPTKSAISGHYTFKKFVVATEEVDALVARETKG